jgi:uncharacterized protein
LALFGRVGRAVRRLVPSYGAGLLFGVGLVISGMTDPRNIVGFLDFAGDWRPNLMGVMIAAIAVHAGLLRLLAAWRSPPESSPSGRLEAPRSNIDARLMLGSAIFGVGWGISGYCPGPAIVALGFGVARVWIFVAAVVAGTLLAGVTVFARPRFALVSKWLERCTSEAGR